jgi:hypothetical protein
MEAERDSVLQPAIAALRTGRRTRGQRQVPDLAADFGMAYVVLSVHFLRFFRRLNIE